MRHAITLTLGTLFIAESAFALTIEEYKKQVSSTHTGYQAAQAQLEAATARKEKGDLVLSPQLTLEASQLSDQKPNQQNGAEQTDLTTYSATLAKPFSTGTKAAVSAVTIGQDLDLAGGAKRESGTGTLGVSISQSLWKDGFGAATRLREKRESKTERLEKAQAYLTLGQAQIDSESAFWDYYLAQEDNKIRKNSLERSEKLLSWMKKRVNQGLAEYNDLLQVQALNASRELQMMQSNDQLEAAQNKFASYLAIAPGKVPDLEYKDRPLRIDDYPATLDSNGKLLRIDSFLQAMDASIKATVADEVRENLKPDLTLSGSYATNSLENSQSQAGAKITDQDNPTTKVALTFSMPLDFGAMSEAKRAAQLDADSSRYKAVRSLADAQLSWEQLDREFKELTKKIEIAKRINEIQREKSNNERVRLERGRTTTFQVVNFEQEADEANLNYLLLKVNREKMALQARLFLRAETDLN
ncbi:MAG: TolC family protein [Pseudobdellovibrionaceae bacterium]